MSRRDTISLQRAKSGNGWILVHPDAARQCAEDLDEVRKMIDSGEPEVARDELRWLLGICHDLIEAHFLLGKVAVESDSDLSLARGHFGVGYQLGLQALRRQKFPKPVPALHPANRAFFDCGRGLVWCLHELDKTSLAREVLDQLLELDPTDPLGLTSWREEIDTAGLQIVDMQSLFGTPGKKNDATGSGEE